MSLPIRSPQRFYRKNEAPLPPTLAGVLTALIQPLEDLDVVAATAIEKLNREKVRGDAVEEFACNCHREDALLEVAFAQQAAAQLRATVLAYNAIFCGENEDV